LLADKLDDEHPDVRVKARHLLQELAAKSEFRDAVIQQGARVLAGQIWRGLEQAAILLVKLDHKPSAERMVQLLTFERPEVLIAAGWGLRRLAVPETLPAVLSRFRLIIDLVDKNEKSAVPSSLPTAAWDQQLSHLAQFMGVSRYHPAEAVFRAQIPRIRKRGIDAPSIGLESRAASIWALGLLHEDSPEPNLVRQLEERMLDVPKPMLPGEDPRVRRMAAVSLGRMKSKESLKTLRLFHVPAEPTLDPVSPACGWAIHHNTGEPLPPLPDMELPAGIFKNWLRPIQESKPKS
jgi:hypothetical protein